MTRISLLLLSASALICGCEATSYPGLPEAGSNNPDTSGTDDLKAQATRIIQQALSSSEPQIRASAIEVVAAIPADYGRKFMPEVQRLLSDEFVPVRFAAAVAIGDTGYRPAAGDVKQMLKDKDNNVQLAADYAILKLDGSETAGQRIRAAMSSSNQQVRANAAFLLGKAGNRSALPLLYEAIKDETSDDRVRLNSVEAIARLGDEKIYEKLWAMLISAYADDRVFGIRAMGALGSPQAKDALLTMLTDDLPEVRLVAAEQLGELGDAAGEKTVVEALTKDAAESDKEGRARIQTLAALAIGRIRTPSLKKFLPELLRNESQLVRLAAAKAVFQCATH